MNFQDLNTTKLGNLGETYLPEFARAKRMHLMVPAYIASFPVDSLCISEEMEVGAIEVKTKPRLMYKRACGYATGYDIVDHQVYMKMHSKKTPVYILFVDHITGSIYGQYCHKLDPFKEKLGSCYVFPLDKMEVYRHLTPAEIQALKEMGNSNYYKE